MDDQGNEDFACPRQDIHEHPLEWQQIILFYGMYLKGHLPDRGAVTDQSHFAMEVFRILDDENRTIDAELERRQRAKDADNGGRR